MIYYKKGYKYQLECGYECKTNIRPAYNILTPYIQLWNDGKLVIERGYAWDGPSGPTIDTKNFMRGSLVHDALYNLMRTDDLDLTYREQADKELRRICREDGMSKIRAWYVYHSVRMFAKSAALPENKKEILTAP